MSARGPVVEWAEVAQGFGSAMPNGSCNALDGSQLCGFPRRADGSCTGGHPAQPADVDLVALETRELERASSFGVAPQRDRRKAVRLASTHTTQENR